MAAATLNSRGQITIPQAVGIGLGLHAGTRVDFVPVTGGFMIVPLRRPGCLSRQHRRYGSSHRSRSRWKVIPRG